MVRSERFFRFGCPAAENASHIIIVCPHFNPPRVPLKRFFQCNGLVRLYFGLGSKPNDSCTFAV